MKLVILSVEKFSSKDKVTQSPLNWAVCYGLAESGKVVKVFMNREKFDLLGIDRFALNKADVSSIYQDYKSCDVVFDENKNIIEVKEVE
jgi:hypothetical protein